MIAERCKDNERTPGRLPISIFPEGILTNGRCIGPFKKGAFASLGSVKPLVIKLDEDQMMVHPTMANPFHMYTMVM